MMDAEVYLDAASAMPLRPEARAAVVEALDVFGDPLTIHGPAREARAMIDDARFTPFAVGNRSFNEDLLTRVGRER